MAHWLPSEKDTFVANDFRGGKFVAVVRNWRTGAERVIPHPVSAVSEDGTWALSINYARLYLTRPDYGYAGEGQNSRRGIVFPEDDGLWRIVQPDPSRDRCAREEQFSVRNSGNREHGQLGVCRPQILYVSVRCGGASGCSQGSAERVERRTRMLLADVGRAFLRHGVHRRYGRVVQSVAG